MYDSNSFSASFNYLSFYISPRLYLSTIHPVRPYFHLGPSISLLISAKQNDLDLKDETEKTDFALQGGFGVKFMHNESFTIDLVAGFEQGFSKVISVFQQQVHNRVAPYIGFGVRYNLK